MELRPERSGDQGAIHALIQAAFETAEHADGNEGQIVDALREQGALAVSLVAEQEGELIGHVALSVVHIEGGRSGEWFGLGPIAVAPRRQREGVGSALMRAALDALRARGASGCVLLGDPAYYARFGFEPAAPLVLEGVPPAYFQALSFSGERPAGRVRYHQAFGA